MSRWPAPAGVTVWRPGPPSVPSSGKRARSRRDAGRRPGPSGPEVRRCWRGGLTLAAPGCDRIGSVPRWGARPAARARSTRLGAVRSFAAQGRKEDDVADVGCIRQQHHQAVDADAAAAGRGQAVFERADVVGVEVHGFLVASVLGAGLRGKAGGLLLGVVELGKAIAVFAAGDEQLEALGDAGFGVPERFELFI